MRRRQTGHPFESVGVSGNSAIHRRSTYPRVQRPPAHVWDLAGGIQAENQFDHALYGGLQACETELLRDRTPRVIIMFNGEHGIVVVVFPHARILRANDHESECQGRVRISRAGHARGRNCPRLNTSSSLNMSRRECRGTRQSARTGKYLRIAAQKCRSACSRPAQPCIKTHRDSAARCTTGTSGRAPQRHQFAGDQPTHTRCSSMPWSDFRRRCNRRTGYLARRGAALSSAARRRQICTCLAQIPIQHSRCTGSTCRPTGTRCTDSIDRAS